MRARMLQTAIHKKNDGHKRIKTPKKLEDTIFRSELPGLYEASIQCSIKNIYLQYLHRSMLHKKRRSLDIMDTSWADLLCSTSRAHDSCFIVDSLGLVFTPLQTHWGRFNRFHITAPPYPKINGYQSLHTTDSELQRLPISSLLRASTPHAALCFSRSRSFHVERVIHNRHWKRPSTFTYQTSNVISKLPLGTRLGILWNPSICCFERGHVKTLRSIR